MKLIFDARPMFAQFSGLGRYTHSLLHSLLSTRTNQSYDVIVLLYSQGESAKPSAHFSLTNFIKDGVCTAEYVDAAPISLRQHLVVSRVVNKINPDKYFYPHFDMPLGISAETTFVIHDLTPVVISDYIQKYSSIKRLYFTSMVKFWVHHSTNCIAVSKTTKKDILSIVGGQYAKKIKVAYEGPILTYTNDMIVNFSNSFIGDLPKSYLLYVGDRRPHKNLSRLFNLFSELKTEHGYEGELVLVGSTKNYGDNIDQMIGRTAHVKVMGNVSDYELLALYEGMDSLVLLSKYEGFGLPVIEAARLGKKMIISDGGSLAEISPPSACVLSNDLPIKIAAQKAIDYIKDDTKAEYLDFNTLFSWEQASRIMFPEAYA